MSPDTIRGVPAPIQLRRPGGKRTLIRCMRYLRPYWAFVVGSYTLLLVNSGITVSVPLIIGLIVDQGIRGNNTHVIRWGALALLGLALVRGVCTFLSGRWTESASQSVAYDLRNAIHEKLQSLSFSYYDQAETGQLLARTVGDVDRIRFITGRAFVRLIGVAVLILAGLLTSMTPAETASHVM